jgi:ethanolamine ammonia-lyase large subunit
MTESRCAERVCKITSAANFLGLPMGVDVCYTNHAEVDQDDSDDLLTRLTSAGATFFMGVQGADDVMLEYQSTSFHDIA